MAEVLVTGLIEGGKATTGPPFGPALGPMGVNTAEVVDAVNKQTEVYGGIKVTVKVFIDSDTKKYRIEIGAPSTSALILKELGLSVGSKTKEEVIGNLTIEQLKKIVAAKEGKIYGKSTKEKIKQIMGTCKSMGVTCEGMNPKEAIQKINSGELKV